MDEMLFRRLWFYGWITLVLLSLMSLWDVSKITCGERIPILLSRALTTDPWRGFVLAFSLIAVASSFFLNSLFMFIGFLGFFSAFLVSMFQTNAHNVLISLSSVAIMYECFPEQNSKWLWKLHWWWTTAWGIVWISRFFYSEFGCATVRCSQCSYFFISEYLFFWSMFILVRWRIPVDEEIHDRIQFINMKKSVETTMLEKNTERVEKKIIF